MGAIYKWSYGHRCLPQIYSSYTKAWFILLTGIECYRTSCLLLRFVIYGVYRCQGLNTLSYFSKPIFRIATCKQTNTALRDSTIRCLFKRPLHGTAMRHLYLWYVHSCNLIGWIRDVSQLENTRIINLCCLCRTEEPCKHAYWGKISSSCWSYWWIRFSWKTYYK